jgi:hypothetical protein
MRKEGFKDGEFGTLIMEGRFEIRMGGFQQ